MDYAIYVSPSYSFDKRALSNWSVARKDLGTDKSGTRFESVEITTPKGKLRRAVAHTDITSYDTEYLIKSMDDFEIWDAFYPVPANVDFAPVQKVKDRLGDKGIIRSHPFSPGQGRHLFRDMQKGFCSPLFVGSSKRIVAIGCNEHAIYD